MLHREREIVPYRGTNAVIYKRRKKEKKERKKEKKKKRCVCVGGGGGGVSFSQHPLPAV